MHHKFYHRRAGANTNAKPFQNVTEPRPPGSATTDRGAEHRSWYRFLAVAAQFFINS